MDAKEYERRRRALDTRLPRKLPLGETARSETALSETVSSETAALPTFRMAPVVPAATSVLASRQPPPFCGSTACG